MVSRESLEEVETAVAPLPSDVFQWRRALEHEAATTKRELEEGFPNLDEKNRLEVLREFMLAPGPRSRPSAADIARYEDMMNAVIQAFHLPPAQTATKLEQLVTELKHPVVVHIPNLIGLNRGRQRVTEQREMPAGSCGLRKAIVFQKDTKIVV